MTQVWMCGSCNSLNDAKAKRCYKCRTDRATGEFKDPTGAAGAPGLRAVPQRDPSLIGGILGGLLAAVVVTAGWYWIFFNVSPGSTPTSALLSGRILTSASLLVGFAIAFGVVIGGRGRTSFLLVLFSVLLTAAALTIGEYLIISQGLAIESGQVVKGIPVARPEDVWSALPGLIRDAPWRPVMWVLALITAWGIPWKRLVGE